MPASNPLAYNTNAKIKAYLHLWEIIIKILSTVAALTLVPWRASQHQLEQHLSYIVIDYRGHHWKGVSIYKATVTILHQKTLF